jgi:farnesyl-diphosphate farnesyltransferase
VSRHADGWTYLRRIPGAELRLRLACAWPLLIGLRTLERIRHAPDLLDPNVRVKISRPTVYGILLQSTLRARWDFLLGRYYARLRRGAQAATTGSVSAPPGSCAVAQEPNGKP